MTAVHWRCVISVVELWLSNKQFTFCMYTVCMQHFSQLAELLNKVIKCCLSVCLWVCLSVWMLTRVAQIVTSAQETCNFACTDLPMNPDHTTVTRSTWPTLLGLYFICHIENTCMCIISAIYWQLHSRCIWHQTTDSSRCDLLFKVTAVK